METRRSAVFEEEDELCRERCREADEENERLKLA